MQNDTKSPKKTNIAGAIQKYKSSKNLDSIRFLELYSLLDIFAIVGKKMI